MKSDVMPSLFDIDDGSPGQSEDVAELNLRKGWTVRTAESPNSLTDLFVETI